MLETLDSVDWDSLPQPPTNPKGEVPAALRALAIVSSRIEAKDAYDRVLFAVGNNHAGTYFPVVLEVVPFLGELLAQGTAPVREAILDILIDLTTSFEPEVGFENMLDESGHGVSVRKVLLRRVAGLLEVVRMPSKDATDRERSLAEDLLTQLGDRDP